MADVVSTARYTASGAFDAPQLPCSLSEIKFGDKARFFTSELFLSEGVGSQFFGASFFRGFSSTSDPCCSKDRHDEISPLLLTISKTITDALSINGRNADMHLA